MPADRQSQVTELFHAALARDPARRDAFLDEACQGDRALKEDVQRVISAHATADSFLELPVGALAGVRRLEAGTRLGPYSITGFIGAGGMGEVYRARDPRLGRDVAIKMLPPAAAGDADRLSRFEREARAIAALNHPNIVTIHSVEHSEGLHFLTMELVEGQTLRELIPSRGMPIGRLLELGVALADALGAAHQQHVVHRDLKPANVMVTSEGRLKVLDFGIAKFTARAVAAVDATTIAPPASTEDGRVIGTIEYMSPEQAEGREVDHRSDIFSFGVVLYELATGRRPFSGESSAAVTSAILRDAPPLVTELRPELPRELGRLIRRCLAKDPSRRYQSAIDLRNELEETRQDVESGALTSGAAGLALAPRPPLLAGRAWLAAAGVVLLAVTAGIAYAVWPRAQDPTPVPLRLNIQLPQGVALPVQSGSPPSILAVSPDGRWIAFRGTSSDPDQRGLYVRSAGEINSRRLVAGEASFPFFSPSSEWLGYWVNRRFWKVAVAGGQPVPICEAPDEPRGATWGDDGTIVFSASSSQADGSAPVMLWRVPSVGGIPPVLLTKPEADKTWYYWPHMLPGSQAVLVTLLQAQERTMGVVSMQTGAVIRPLGRGAAPHFVNGGFLVYRGIETEILYAAPFDVQRLALTGEGREVLDGVAFNPAGSETSAFDVARTGALVYMTRVGENDAALEWVDPEGRTDSLGERLQDYQWLALDTKGARVAMHIGRPGDRDLWTYDIRTKRWLRKTTARRTDGSIAWSSDGQWLIFTSLVNSGRPLFRIPAEGGGRDADQLTFAGSGSFSDPYDHATSVYGNVVLFQRQVGTAQQDLLTVPLDPPGPEAVFLHSGFRTTNAQISPGGRWVAYQTDESGGQHLYVRPFSGSRQWAVAPDARGPRWSPDGRRLFFMRGREVWSVAVTSSEASADFTFSAEQLFLKHGSLPSAGPVPSFDGKRFLVARRPPEERVLVFVPNVVGEIRAKMAR